MRVKSKLIDNGVAVTLDQIIPSNSEGEEFIECKMVKVFRETLLSALKQGEDVTIIVKRNTNTAKAYIS